MRLATYERGEEELWGLVVKDPFDGKDWVFNPARAEETFQTCAANVTNGMAHCQPRFSPKGGWPGELREMLGQGEDGMDCLRRFEAFLLQFLQRGDRYSIQLAGDPLDAVHLRAPIPRPRLMWGLVQNCPSFWRNDPNRRIANFFPQGHQRPMSSVVGHREIFLHAAGFNVELAVVIGKGGKYIPVDEAMDHVAGYSVVIDSQINHYYGEFDQELAKNRGDLEREYDWYAGATCSWGGKKSDCHCVMGPWITTKEEVGNPYDLLVYTLQNGCVRDRSHTAGMSLGIERTIHWYSSFATLYPGDVIHMGTAGTDGIRVTRNMDFGAGNVIESEIERIGRLQARVLDTEQFEDWRSDEEKELPSLIPAARDLIRSHQNYIARPEDWDVSKARNLWTCFANYRSVQQVEGLRPAPSPRFLNGPNSSLGRSGGSVLLPPRATTLDVGVELAFVIRKLASTVKDGWEDYIFGYLPLISVSDRSFQEKVIHPCTPQEEWIPTVYGRWGDGYNVAGSPVTAVRMVGRRMSLTVEGVGKIHASTDEYQCTAERVLEFISSHITLFPGDVVTLGRVSQRIAIPPLHSGQRIRLEASIEGLESVWAVLERES